MIGWAGRNAGGTSQEEIAGGACRRDPLAVGAQGPHAQLLIRSGINMDGAEVTVLGRGTIVGKPMAAILLQKAPHANCTVTLCHSGTRDITRHTMRADIIIAAMGVPRFLKAEMVRPGAVIIDVGVNRIQDSTAPSGSRLVGDVDFDAVREKAGWITPNPGGVGPMTIALLLSNTATAAGAPSVA